MSRAARSRSFINRPPEIRVRVSDLGVDPAPPFSPQPQQRRRLSRQLSSASFPPSLSRGRTWRTRRRRCARCSPLRACPTEACASSASATPPSRPAPPAPPSSSSTAPAPVRLSLPPPPSLHYPAVRVLTRGAGRQGDVRAGCRAAARAGLRARGVGVRHAEPRRGRGVERARARRRGDLCVPFRLVSVFLLPAARRRG